MVKENTFTRDFITIMTQTGIDRKNFRFVLRGTQKFDNEDIADLVPLSTRSANALYRNNIFTVGQLMDSWNLIGSLKNVGKKSVKEIKTGLIAWYYAQLSEEGRKQFWRDSLAM